MKDKTIDYILRATLKAVSRMYNEASKYGATMATGFALLSMDKINILHHWDQSGMEATSLTRT
jgi:hypothetical protein